MEALIYFTAGAFAVVFLIEIRNRQLRKKAIEREAANEAARIDIEWEELNRPRS